MSKDGILSKITQYRFAVAAGSVALVLLVVLLMRAPKTGALEDVLQTRSDVARRMETNIRQGDDLAEHLRQLREQNILIDKRLMERSEVASNYNYFYQLEETVGVRVEAIQQRGQAAGVSAGRPSIDLYDLIGYSMTVRGSFSDLLTFVRELETGRYFIRLESINFNRAQGGSGAELSAQIELNVLGRKS